MTDADSERIYTGECFCAAVQYTITGPITETRSCHCSRCRKAFNGAGSAVAWIDPAQFQWRRGEASMSYYTNRQGVALGFCGECGSTLVVTADGTVVSITLGTLDADATDIAIKDHIFVDSRACWDEIGGDAPQYAEHPPAAAEEGN